jgi:hypothetical protein
VVRNFKIFLVIQNFSPTFNGAEVASPYLKYRCVYVDIVDGKNLKIANVARYSVS